MNANSKPKAPKLSDWLGVTTRRLTASGIDTARLDVELILAHVLGVNRTWLIAHSDEELSDANRRSADRLVAERLARQPLAYLTGHKEFYGRDFMVTPDVLIPRPESEDLIDLLKLAAGQTPVKTVLDIGTGSGALAISANLELDLPVIAADISPAALAVARDNADKLGAQIIFHESDLLNSLPSSIFHQPVAILANLPYVDRDWQRSPETDWEPDLALFAGQHGLALINQLITQADQLAITGSWLILEADPEQHPAIINTAADHDWRRRQVQGYALAFSR